MKLRSLSAVLLGAALAITPALAGVGPHSTSSAEAAPAAPSATPPPVRIMLAGDSITQGFDGDFTWRYRMDRELRRQGVRFDFVGPRRFTYGGANHYRITSGWDTDHDATGGTRLGSVQLFEIVSDMHDYNPDVLVALYGTTDLLHGATVNDVIGYWRDFIQKAREVRADVKIVLGEIYTRKIPDNKRRNFNAAINKLAASQTQNPSFPDSRVVVADIDFSGWSPSRNTYDTVHPTPVGEAVIAQRVALALRALRVLPQTPAIKSAGLIWNPAWAPKVRVTKGRHIAINWSETKFLNKPQLMRAKIKRLANGAVGVGPYSYASSFVTGISFKPGLYKVYVQGKRQAMVSPWSKPFLIRVR